MRTIDLVRPIKIVRIDQESSNIRSFFFRDERSLSAEPGQFAMIWLPSAGEFPMSISVSSKDGLASIGVKAMGAGSKALYDCQVGSILGIRGPYGNSFKIDSLGKKKSNVLLVGGGTGMVPMAVLANELSKLGINTKAVIGARTKIELPFLKITSNALGKNNVFPTTDDGSYGFKGFAHQLVRELVKKNEFDMIFSCGPEKMMSSLLEVANQRHIPVQFSLERLMKCGIGICGSCTIGKFVLCKDGPVMRTGQLGCLLSEFGKMHRDKSGKLGPL